MSYRERQAWITFFSVLVCFGVYFSALLTGVVSYGLPAVRLFMLCVVALVILQVVFATVSALSSPAEAKAPADERERLIDGRARTIGYYVLLVGALAVAIPGHTGGSKVDMMNVVMAAIVVAELSVCGAQIIMYRRGA